MANEVRFYLKLLIDGKEHVVEATTDVKNLAREIEKAGTESAKMRDELLKFTQTAQVFRDVLSSLQGLTSGMREYTDAYNEQVVAETKLAVNMRNMMNATDAEVESIKELCAAQQELGVIGDEVQLAGAQELATYLQKKSSLEELIPVMNDMLAQQYGLNATQEEAATIAQMLGKVMEGQVGALSRYGYYFDEAQEQVLKFGTEEERAAMLAEVVESAVGGMNAELAKTDAGQAKQTANAIGDLKEVVGEALRPLGELMEGLDGIAAPASHVATLISSLYGLNTVVKTVTSSTIVHKTATLASAAASKVASATQAVWNYQLRLGKQAELEFAFGANAAAVATTALRWAMLGLMAVSGVGLAFMAVSTVLSLFGSKAKDATKDMEEAKKAQEDLTASMQEATGNAYSQAASGLEVHKQKLEALIEAKKQGKDVSKDEKKIVGELNDAYGGTMGYFDSVAKWYEALTANSETYCKQMIIEAKTRMLANQIASKEMENHDLIYDEKGGKKKYSKTREKEKKLVTKQAGMVAMADWELVDKEGSSELDKVGQQIKDNNAAIADMKKQMRDAVKEAGTLEFKVKGSTVRPGDGSKGSKGSKGQDDSERKWQEKWRKQMDDAAEARRKAAAKAADEERKEKQREMEDKWRYLEEYGTYEQKRLAITEEFEEKIRQARNPWEKEKLKGEMQRELSKAKLEEAKEELDWEGLFNNLDRYSADFLQGIRGKLQELLRSGELDTKDSEIVASKIEDIDEVVREKSGSTFRWINEYLAEQKRLQGEAAQAAAETEAARAKKAGALAELDGAKENVETLKANGVAEESEEMKVAMDRLAVAEANAASATAELTKAEGKQANAEAKTKIPLKEKVAGWLKGVNDNVEKYLGDVPQLFEQLGWGDMGDRVSKGIEGVNQAAGAAADFATGNYVGALSKGLSAVTSFTGMFGGEGNIEENNRCIKELTTQSEVLAEVMEGLKDEIANGTLTESLEAYYKAVETSRAQQDVARARIGEEAGKWKRGTHSVNSMLMDDDAMRGMMDQVSRIIGRNVEQMWWLTGDELQKVMDTDSALYANILKRIQGAENDKTGQNIAGMIEELRQTYAGVEEELEEMRKDALTTMTFDSVKNGFADILKDMSSDVDDFGEHIEKTLAEAFLNRVVLDKYSKELEDWYNGFAGAMGDGNLSEEEVEWLKNWYTSIGERAKADRDTLKTVGIDLEEGTTQTGKAGGFTAMSQDQGTKLEGLFTSGLMHWSSMDERMENVSEKMGRASDHLARIEENTGKTAELLVEIKAQGEKMIRDGVKVK